ncbi:Phage integrase family protein [Thermomonospora echinospora]|uniref:Phage integrase family protein n=1 Tax=Thermomonospora echinospora TaxID=1992 RepID=A0A1H5VZ78_9ACTN|nr:site-specific integrase [Thermomonospora echinospora]SEF92328.1 Phage integrase family protein [Thermomonospora echinospora]
MKSNRIRFWEIRPNYTEKSGKRVVRSYTVRWTVAGREKSETFTRKSQADRFRGRLMSAAEREPFDVETGLPDSMRRERSSMTWYKLACAFIDDKWPRLAAKGRVSVVEGLMAVTPVLVKSQRGAPDPKTLRLALRNWAFNPPRRESDKPEEIAAALRWLEKASVPVSALEEARTVAKALDACAMNLNGKPSKPQYYRRRRRGFYGALKYAVREKQLSANPLDTPDEVDWKPPEVVHAIDRRRVPNPDQVAALLEAVRQVGKTQGPRLVALFGCMYYAMLRPSEAINLRKDDCTLPAEGWGLLELEEVKSAAGRRWTDNGEVHETRGLKGRPKDTVRRVPIPPELVELLREHIDTYGAGLDGRLFRTYRGGVYQPSTLWRVLNLARQKALTPKQVKTPLAGKPYDFRHAGVSWRLNAGVPAVYVAEWAGHSVEVLQRIYAHCLDGDDGRWFQRMDAALGR